MVARTSMVALSISITLVTCSHFSASFCTILHSVGVRYSKVVRGDVILAQFLSTRRYTPASPTKVAHLFRYRWVWQVCNPGDLLRSHRPTISVDHESEEWCFSFTERTHFALQSKTLPSDRIEYCLHLFLVGLLVFGIYHDVIQEYDAVAAVHVFPQ
ncbi:hypothetical protein K440DRAFT_677703 [Wilcoxina mikolae CBS 423.85]|nr:hypothetical protein K440DRAFT_677703 [Wilcoxina mikolae CBS 423.85]